ncbi:sugar isomerase domain-containing protein [Algoriphagus namhaensis]
MSQSFLHVLQSKLDEALSQNAINMAAEWTADVLRKEGWIYVFGTGHSHLLAEEIFYRAGGLARVRPILIPSLMLHDAAYESSAVERKEGFAKDIIKDYPISSGDLVWIISNSGRNAVPVELALESKKRGARVIGLTNLNHSRSVTSRHSSGSKLYELSDLVLDNFGEVGDTSMEIPGLSSKLGATSTIIGAAILHAVILEAVGICLSKDHFPEIFHSSNTDSGELINENLIKKYKNEVKGL